MALIKKAIPQAPKEVAGIISSSGILMVIPTELKMVSATDRAPLVLLSVDRQVIDS